MPDFSPSPALVVTDVQNDFVLPAGALCVRGGEEVLEAVNREIQRATQGGALVAYTQDWHPPSPRILSTRVESGRSIAWPGPGGPSS